MTITSLWGISMFWVTTGILFDGFWNSIPIPLFFRMWFAIVFRGAINFFIHTLISSLSRFISLHSDEISDRVWG